MEATPNNLEEPELAMGELDEDFGSDYHVKVDENVITPWAHGCVLNRAEKSPPAWCCTR